MRRGGGEDEQYRGRPPYAFPLTAGGNAPPDGEEAGDEAEARAHDARHLDGPPPGRRHPARAAQREEARGIGQDSAAEYLRAGLAVAESEKMTKRSRNFRVGNFTEYHFPHLNFSLPTLRKAGLLHLSRRTQLPPLSYLHPGGLCPIRPRARARTGVSTWRRPHRRR